MLSKIKKRWGLNTNGQLAVILFIFASTGISSLFVREYTFNLLGINDDTNFWLKVILYIAIVFPSYQVLFLIIGTLLGKFNFVWEFEKKMFANLKFWKKEYSIENQ